MDSSAPLSNPADTTLVSASASAAPTNEPWAELKGYTQAKNLVGQAVRLMADVFRQSNSEHLAAACRDLLAKLAEDRFTLAVLGQFNRGKSSLMNAIVGRELLPTGVLPLTSAVTVLRFGPEERLVVTRKGRSLAEHANLASLPRFVTQQGNPGNQQQVESVYVEIPHPFLRRGLEFVDTPGVGSAIEANTATTLSFLPRCDAAIFVTSADSPLTTVETEFLNAVRQHVRKLFLVINKLDLLVDEDRGPVLAYAAQTLQERLGTADVRIYPVSARWALETCSPGDASARSRSGLAALEADLADFLSSDRGCAFLVAVLDKALGLATAGLRELDFVQQARAVPVPVRSHCIARLRDGFRRLQQEREQEILRLREQARKWIQARVIADLDSFWAEQVPQLTEEMDRNVRSVHAFFAAAGAKAAACRLANRLRESAAGWLESRRACLEAGLNEAVSIHTETLADNLAAIPAVAVAVFEGSPSAATAVVPLTSPTLRLGSPALSELHWTPSLSAAEAYCPLAMVRGRLRRCLPSQLAELAATLRERVVATLDGCVIQAVDRVRVEAAARAAEAENRLLKTASGLTTIAQELPGTTQDPAERMQEQLAGISRRLIALRDTLADKGLRDGACAEVGESEASSPAIAGLEALAGPQPVDEGTLMTNLRAWGCPICSELVRVALDFFTESQYELANHEAAQRAHAAQRGFCPLHTWQLAAMASPIGLSVGHAAWLADLSHRLAALADSPQDAGAELSGWTQDPRDCRVCRLLRSAEDAYAARLAAWLAEPSGRDAYASSHGVCLRHLRFLVSLASTPGTVEFLLRHAAARCEALSEDMRSYVIKREALRHALVNRDEEEAYLRALVLLAGHRQLSLPPSKEREI